MHFKKQYFILGVLVFVLLYLLDPISLVETKEVKLNAYIANSSLTSNESKAIMEQFKGEYNYVSNEKEEYSLVTDLFLSVSDPNPAELMDAGRLTAQIAGKELDILISNKEVIEHYYKLEGFENLNELIGEKALFADEQLLNDQNHTYAVQLKTFSNQYHLTTDTWIAIPRTSERKETAVQFIEYLLKEF
ncbi:hypothetical protein [Marinilactibacillus psychrotolerans]|uniref:Extracellular solute-binding protein n=1 Tax=Marinilactibacillus psychrotolerans TaxID=191770 RepID=A0AAV3WTU0_9LACT|nr:hypothetical protein [Marinilactibacillus psychrotolerans]GEL67170.1 hypothetical protein MPS01_13250 [Marinilactibacillus psychrotolerans]GEQ35417.1 hypothetical protein M132T_09250 [Marinilactibacillus psychrotolerans]SDC89929.1 hypothetical protein SAMN04488013_11163 [Marinilactibacillus psychrotolerans]